jgi:protein-L-isoaspartate(D-aspartate) O-methyltransferase
MERQPERQAMLEEQLRRRGIRDKRVLHAMREVPRHRFVDPQHDALAYTDQALPIAAGQTISQPYIVALMAAALELRGTERVLEIGTGSGYAAAVLGSLAAAVFTVERHRDLAQRAAVVFGELGYTTIRVGVGDGTLGWPEHAPYDAITVAAGGPRVPRPLLDQLADGGRLVMPIGQRDEQRLVRVTRHDTRFTETVLGPVRFVPLIGEQGWGSD